MNTDLTDEQILKMVAIMNEADNPTSLPLSQHAIEFLTPIILEARTHAQLDLIKELKEQSDRYLDVISTIEAVPLSVLEAKEKELNNEL